MQFTVAGVSQEIQINHAYVAGWTGRNREAVDHHIQELAELGITPPSTVPLYYRVSNSLLTQTSHIEVLGAGTSGEVEPLLIQAEDALWLGLASDHTDRDLEVHSVAASKQACSKPVADELWSYQSVSEHIDSLELRCSIKEAGNWITYQEGSLVNISPLTDLMKKSDLQKHSAMLCGTLGAIGGVRPASEYKMELRDPVLEKRIELNYTVSELPIVS